MRSTIAATALAMLGWFPMQASTSTPSTTPSSTESRGPVAVNNVSVAMTVDGAMLFIDPTGDQARYRHFGRPDIVVLTSADYDHLSIDTMIGMLRRDTLVLAPRSVIDQLPPMISNNVLSPFDAGTVQEVGDITFTALSASADIPPDTRVHARKRGEITVVVEIDGASFLF